MTNLVRWLFSTILFLFCRPIFRLFFVILYYGFWQWIVGYGDSTNIFLFHSISEIESSVRSNSISGIPDASFHLEDPVQNKISAPNLIPFDPVEQFRLRNLDQELELFARIPLLEGRLIEGLPPQLNLGEYDTLLRGFIDETITIRHYCQTITNELFDIGVMERKADLVEQLFDLFVHEPPEQLSLILQQSNFSERAIRQEALSYLNDNLNRLDLTDVRSNLDKISLEAFLQYWHEEIEVNGHQSHFYLMFKEHFRGS